MNSWWTISNSNVKSNVRGTRQLTSSKGPVRMGICNHEQGITSLSKIIFPFKQIHTFLILCIYSMCGIKKSYLCRLKINHTSGSKSCIYSWYTGPHGSEQLSFLQRCIYKGFVQFNSEAVNI
jgi:hypothetical protein